MTEKRRKPEEDLQRFIRKAIVAFAVIGLTSAVALAGFGIVLHNEKKKSLELCEARNIRHDNAITALKIGSDLDQKNAPNEAARAEIRRRRDVTIAIIDGVQPRTNCLHPVKPKRLEVPK